MQQQPIGTPPPRSWPHRCVIAPGLDTPHCTALHRIARIAVQPCNDATTVPPQTTCPTCHLSPGRIGCIEEEALGSGTDCRRGQTEPGAGRIACGGMGESAVGDSPQWGTFHDDGGRLDAGDARTRWPGRAKITGAGDGCRLGSNPVVPTKNPRDLRRFLPMGQRSRPVSTRYKLYSCFIAFAALHRKSRSPSGR